MVMRMASIMIMGLCSYKCKITIIQKQKMRKNSQEAKTKSKAKKSQKKQEKSTQVSMDVLKITKQGFAKIKSRIEHTVTKKNLMHLIKKSASTIPHLLTKQQSKALLPKLQKIMLPESRHDQGPVSSTKFQEIEGQLTQSMVMFKRTSDLQRNDLWAIDLQTQKCYKIIPQIYFKQHMNSEQLTRNLLLTKNHKQMQESMLTLGDFLDQVQFNINQQASAKIKIFMNFVMCTNSIQDLVNINLSKISATRKHTGILRDIIVSRAVRINQQRLRKERVQEALDLLLLLKKLKGYETKLLAQITVGNFIPHDSKTKLGAMFHEYCQLHNMELNKICCQSGKNRCKYWDITYFVERGFQENFMKVVRNYLFEVINYHREIQNFKKALTVNKKNFMTTPYSAHVQHTNNVDESFQVDTIEHVQLFTKIYIQKQIISLFQQGLHRYTFSTQSLQKQLKQFLSQYINSFLKQCLAAVDNDSRVSLRQLSQVQEANYYESQRCREKILKLNWGLFCKLVDMVLLRFQYLSSRLLSLVEKLLQKAEEIREESPERYEVFCAYMSQLVSTQMQQSDTYICTLLKNRLKDSQKSLQIFKSRQDIMKQFDIECENMKKLVKYCNKWISHVQSLQKSYGLVRASFERVVKSKKNIKEKDENGEMGRGGDGDEGNGWVMRVAELKGGLVKNMYQLLHKTITSRDLKQKLEEERWQFIDIKTHIYNDLGYIIGGKDFLALQQRNHRQSLSKSILMDKSYSQIQRSQHGQNPTPNHSPQTQYNKQQYSSRFKINPNHITLNSIKFKITTSSEQLIQFLRKYLQLYDQISDKKKKPDLQAKLTQLILMYNQYIKDLIVKGEALKFDKIKTKSITARQLVITYMQLLLIDYVYTGEIMQRRVGMTKEECLVMHEKMLATQLEIRKKYQRIIDNRITDAIELINPKQQHWLQSQPMLSIPKNFQSSIQLFSQLTLHECQYQKFVDLQTDWAASLLNKVSKGPKGKQYKIKCFTFLMEEIKPYVKYLPKLVTAVRSVLY